MYDVIKEDEDQDEEEEDEDDDSSSLLSDQESNENMSVPNE